MMMVVDIVMVEVDVMGVFIIPSGEVNLLAILDMILKVTLVDHVVILVWQCHIWVGQCRRTPQRT
jgi:hypothetical protein